MSDVRFAVRQLGRSPGFTAVSILTLAVGTGACIAMFSIVDGVLLRPPPQAEPSRVVLLHERFQGGAQDFMAPAGRFVDWQAQARSFERLCATGGGGRTFHAGDADAVRVKGLVMSVGTLATLGIQPLLGRDFLPEEERANGTVVILGHGFWQRQFGGRADVVGRRIQLDGMPVTVVGVLPKGVEIPDGNGVIDNREVEVYTPLGLSEGQRREYRGHWLKVFGRLRPGVTVAEAQQEMNALSARIAAAEPASTGWSVRLVPLPDSIVGSVRPALYALLAGVGFLLLIACANVANLLLARALARAKEIAVRAALGASRGRLVRQLLVEGLVIGGLGGALGLIVAHGALAGALALAPANLPRTQNIAIDARAVVFALLLAVVTGVAFGLVPALYARQGRLHEVLRQTGRGTSEGGTRLSLRGALVAGQVAVAVVLLAGAGLLVRSFVGLLALSPGFEPSNVLTLRVNLDDGREARERPAAFAERVVEELARLPGVRAAAVSSRLPFLESDQTHPFQIPGRPGQRETDLPVANHFSIGPDYFRAMGIPVLQGRAFDARDRDGATRVAIISASIARRFFPGQSPLGRHIDFYGIRTIVGVVGDVKTAALDGSFSLQIYQPFAQMPLVRTQFVLRTDGPPEALLAAARAVLTRLDRRIPIYNVTTLSALVGTSIARQRFAMTLLTAFSILALLLAAVGIYGVMAYAVSRRTPELGIRVALGAPPANILRLVCTQSARLIIAGLVTGLAAALLLTRYLQSLLHELTPQDPATFTGAILVLLTVAATAAVLPARRALRIDPMSLLRSE